MKRDPKFYKKLGRKLRAARLKAGLTQREVGDSVGMTRAWVATLENGRIRVDAEMLLMVGKKLGK